MEKVRPWCGQPLDRGRLRNRTEQKHRQHNTTVLRYFFQEYLDEPVPEENFWTLCCKGRLTEADTPTIWLGATPTGLSSAHLNHPPIFFTGQMPFLPPKRQHQSTVNVKNDIKIKQVTMNAHRALSVAYRCGVMSAYCTH